MELIGDSTSPRTRTRALWERVLSRGEKVTGEKVSAPGTATALAEAVVPRSAPRSDGVAASQTFHDPGTFKPPPFA